MARAFAAEQTLQFTLGMKWARHLMAIVTSLVAGAVTRWISPSSRWAPLIVGSGVLVMFVPLHIAIWSKFPVWYHLLAADLTQSVPVGLIPEIRRMREQVFSAGHDCAGLLPAVDSRGYRTVSWPRGRAGAELLEAFSYAAGARFRPVAHHQAVAKKPRARRWMPGTRKLDLQSQPD